MIRYDLSISGGGTYILIFGDHNQAVTANTTVYSTAEMDAYISPSTFTTMCVQNYDSYYQLIRNLFPNSYGMYSATGAGDALYGKTLTDPQTGNYILAGRVKSGSGTATSKIYGVAYTADGTMIGNVSLAGSGNNGAFVWSVAPGTERIESTTLIYQNAITISGTLAVPKAIIGKDKTSSTTYYKNLATFLKDTNPVGDEPEGTIYYNGEWHTDFVWNGYYHKKIYKGSNLWWEKPVT